MKKALLFLILLAGYTGGIGCSKTDGTPKFLSGTPAGGTEDAAPAQNESQFDSLKNPQLIQTLIYHVGPTELPATAGAATGVVTQANTLSFQVGEPVWVIGFEPKILDANGNKLPGFLLNKAVLINKNESNPLCASAGSGSPAGGNPFAMATSSLTKIEFPNGFGYPLLPDQQLEARVTFQNQPDQDYDGVTFSFELIAVPMEKAKNIRDIQALLLDQDESCELKPMKIEPGAFVEKSKTFTIPFNGELLVANGLLTDYGVAVSLIHHEGKNISATPFWRAEAKMDETHHIVELNDNPFFDPSGKELRQGDKITLGVSFDNFSDTWHDQASGSAMLYISPTQ